MAVFGALRHSEQVLLDLYWTSDLCPGDLCPQVVQGLPTSLEPGSVTELVDPQLDSDLSSSGLSCARSNRQKNGLPL